VHPDLADHLRRALQVGTVCSYAPRQPATWTVRWPNPVGSDDTGTWLAEGALQRAAETGTSLGRAPNVPVPAHPSERAHWRRSL